MAEFKVQIGADIAEAIKGFDAVSAKAVQFSAQVSKLPFSLKPPDTAAVTSAIDEIKKDLASVPALTIPVNVDDIPSIPPIEVPVHVEEILLPEIDNSVSVQVSADAKQALATFDKLESEAAQTTSALNKIPAALKPINSKTIDVLDGSVKKLKTDIQGLNFNGVTNGLKSVAAPAQAASKAIATIPRGSNQAGNALMNLGRIAQDAPFGFIGIQNNINPLLESFQRLKAETGSTGGALKSLASGLTGPAGIGLAFSVVSGILLAYGEEILAWANKLTFAQKQQEALNKAIGEAQASTQGEIANIRSLVAIAGDEALSRGARTQALQTLQDQYPAYFENVKFDGKLTENLKLATDKLTQSILLNAKAKAIQGQIEASATRVAEAQNKSLLGNLTLLDKTGAVLGSIFRSQASAGAAALSKGLQRLGETVKEEEALQKSLADQLTATNKEMAVQGTLFDKKPKALPKPKESKEDDALKVRIKQLEDIKKQVELTSKQSLELLDLQIRVAVRDQNITGLTPDQLNKVIKEKIGDFTARTEIPLDIIPEANVKKINTSLAAIGKTVSNSINFDAIPQKLDAALVAAQARAATFSEALNKLLHDAAVEGAASIGAAIGTALAGGDMDSVFKSFINFLADGLIQLGKTAIGIGVTLTGLKAALQTLGGPAAIAIGIAAVGLGTAIKASIPKFAEGAMVTGPTLGIFGEAGPEVVFPLKRFMDLAKTMGGGGNDSGGRITTTLSGTDIVLAYDRTSKQYGSSFRK